MVMQNSMPSPRWVSTIQNPPNTSQIRFITVERQPTGLDVSLIFTPKGANPTIANLKHWMPNGIPTIVKQRIIPPKMYSKKMNNPPKITQIMLPIKLMPFLILRVEVANIVTASSVLCYLNRKTSELSFASLNSTSLVHLKFIKSCKN